LTRPLRFVTFYISALEILLLTNSAFENGESYSIRFEIAYNGQTYDSIQHDKNTTCTALIK